ncbi:unnamed protein product [Calypogeia fissa]
MEKWTTPNGKQRNFIEGDDEGSAIPMSERLQSPLVITGPDGKIMTWDTPQKKFVPWSDTSKFEKSRVKQQLLKITECEASSSSKLDPRIPLQSIIRQRGCLTPQSSGKNGLLQTPQYQFWTPRKPPETPVGPEYGATPITPPSKARPPMSSCRKPRSKSGMRLRMLDDQELQASRVVQARQNLLMERQERVFTAWLNHVFELHPTGGRQVSRDEDSVARKYSITSLCSNSILLSTDLQLIEKANCARDFVASPVRDLTYSSRSLRSPLAPLNGVGNRGFRSLGLGSSDRRALKDVFSTPDGKSCVYSPAGLHSSPKKLRLITEHGHSYSRDAHMQDVCRKSELARRLTLHFGQTETGEILAVITELAKYIDEGRLRMKRGCIILADVALRKKAIRLLLNYNPCWMRIGLHAVLGHTTSLEERLQEDDSKQTTHKNVQAVQFALLKVFIKKHFFALPDQATESTTNKKTEGFYRDEHSEALGRVILKRFFLLVLVLDKVKCQTALKITDGIDGVDGGSPPLFRSDARLKSSTQVLQEFLSDVMHGEGDLIENLGALGYHVHHHQVPLADYDFAVVNLIEDLRDGVRLCRLVQLVAENDSRMLEHIQVPSNGRKRQLHNCQIALNGLARTGVPLEDEDGGSINAEDIIDGNKDKVFSLLWNIMVHLQIPVLVSRARLCQEIAKLQGTEGRVALGLNVGTVELLLKWTQVTCMISGDFCVRNFKSSFGDGYGFFLILKLYLPQFLSGNALLRPASPSHYEEQIGKTPDGKVTFSSTYKKVVAHNFRLVQDAARKVGCIPEVLQLEDLLVYPEISERNIVVFIAFLCSFLLKDNAPVLNTQTTGRISQGADGNHQLDELLRWGSQRKSESESLSAFNRFYSVPWPLLEASCPTSPEVYKSLTQVNENSPRIVSEDIVGKVCKIQAWWRTRLMRPHVSSHQRTSQIERHRASAHLKIVHSSAVRIQAHWRGYVVRRMLKSWTAAAVVIQLRYRAPRNCRREQAAHVLQCCFRAWAQKRKHRAAVSNMCKIQAFWWANEARGNFERERKAVHTIEGEWLNSLARRRLHGSPRRQCSESAQLIQAHWRGYFTRRILKRRSSAVLVIQSWVRGHFQTREYRRQKDRIQNENIRRIQHTHIARIQACWRRHLVKCQFQKLVQAAKTIQRAWRILVALRKKQLTDRAIKVDSSTRIQAHWRGLVARRKLYLLRQAVIKVQRGWRQLVARRNRRREQQAATKIQRKWRHVVSLRTSHLLDSTAQSIIAEQTTACIRIQAWWRKHAARQQFEIQKHAARKIQRKWRQWIARTPNRDVSALAIHGSSRGHFDLAIYSTLETSAIASQRCQYRDVRRKSNRSVQECLAIETRTRQRTYLQRRNRKVNVTSARIVKAGWRAQSCRRQFPIQRNSAKTLGCDDGATRIQATSPGMVERRRIAEQRKTTSEKQLVFRARQANTVSVQDQQTLRYSFRSSVVFQTSLKNRLMLRGADSNYIVLLKIKSFCEVQQLRQQHEAVLLCQVSKPESSMEVNFALDYKSVESGVCLQEAQADSANLHVCKETIFSGNIFQALHPSSTCTYVILTPTGLQQYVKYLLQQPDSPSCGTAVTALARTTCETFESEGCHLDCDSSCLQRFLAPSHYIRRDHHARKNIGLKDEAPDTDCIHTRCLSAGNVLDQSSLACKNSSPQKFKAAHVIFSWFQTFRQRATYLRMRRCVIVIQRHSRGRIHRSKFARVKASAVKIQAHWRAFLVRRGQSEPQNPWRELRRRIRSNAVGVQDTARLYNRLVEALSMLARQETVSGILSTCRTIDVATQHSYKCCERLAEAGAITTILLLMQTINRSPPLEQVLKHALSIISNLARHLPLATRVAQSPSAITIISEQLHTFRNDEGVFLQAMSLLEMVCKTSAGIEVLQRERSIVRRLILIAQSLEGNFQPEKRTVETLPWATPAAMQRKSAQIKMREVIYNFLSTVGLMKDVSRLPHCRTITSITPLRRQHPATAPADSFCLVAPSCLDAKRVGLPKLATTARQALSPRNGRLHPKPH